VFRGGLDGQTVFLCFGEELETLVRENLHNPMVLGQVREELAYRESDRAKALMRDVMGILRGESRCPESRRRRIPKRTNWPCSMTSRSCAGVHQAVIA
jgi:hypothetical protein